MTTELFVGGLMILTLVAGVVIAMTSTRNSTDRRFGDDYRSSVKGQGQRRPSRKSR